MCKQEVVAAEGERLEETVEVPEEVEVRGEPQEELQEEAAPKVRAPSPPPPPSA